MQQNFPNSQICVLDAMVSLWLRPVSFEKLQVSDRMQAALWAM